MPSLLTSHIITQAEELKALDLFYDVSSLYFRVLPPKKSKRRISIFKIKKKNFLVLFLNM
jgi:hypothetical protein